MKKKWKCFYREKMRMVGQKEIVDIRMRLMTRIDYDFLQTKPIFQSNKILPFLFSIHTVKIFEEFRRS